LALSAFVSLAGCSSQTDDKSPVSGADPAAPADNSGGHGHAHPSEGPHHGQLIELGQEEYHAELVHDDDAGTVTVYILDGSVKNAVPIEAAELLINLKHDGKGEQFKLTASPDKGDPDGRSSRFVSDDAELSEDLDAAGTEARLVVMIDGKSFSGDLHHSHTGHGHSHGHSHAGDDALIWRRDDIKHEGFDIQLGHHGKHLHAGKPVEPAVSITRNGKPVADAKVFNALVAADGKTELVGEVPTVYEPTTKDEPAHYAQGPLKVPEDSKSVIIRYRIVLPGDAGEVKEDVEIDIE
jgi:hypothetical protein